MTSKLTWNDLEPNFMRRNPETFICTIWLKNKNGKEGFVKKKIFEKITQLISTSWWEFCTLQVPVMQLFKRTQRLSTKALNSIFCVTRKKLLFGICLGNKTKATALEISRKWLFRTFYITAHSQTFWFATRKLQDVQRNKSNQLEVISRKFK